MQTHTEQPTTNPETAIPAILTNTLVGCGSILVLLFILNIICGDSRTGRDPDDARMATWGERRKAKRKGLKQRREGERDKVGLCLGSDNPIVLPDNQPLIKVLGAAGEGKTETVIEPILCDAIKQGHTLFVFDVKGTLKEKFIPYALKQPIPYKPYILAPGKKYSDSLDFLGFMEDHNDDLTAGATVTTFFDNVIAASDGKNAFFDSFAVFTLTALMMMSKHPDSSMPDLPMVWEYLALPSLGKRLVAAVHAGFFDESGFGPWAKRELSGLLSTAGTHDTEAGITASAMNVLMPLLSRKFYPCLSYPFHEGSTIPLDLKGRQIVFFELDGLAMQQTSPLVATALNMLIRRNLNEHSDRDRPLGIILDEYARIVLPDFEQIVSLNRSYGFYAVTAFQSNSQPNIKQKSEVVKSIFDNTAAQFIFRTEDFETRKQLEEDIGDYELKRNTKSRSHGKQGTNRTVSEAPRRKPLISRHRLKRLGKGQFVLLSAGIQNRPVIHQYRRWWRNRTDIQRLKECKQMYKEHLVPVINRKLEQNMQVEDEEGNILTFTIEELQENRAQAADWNLPFPDEIEADEIEAKEQEDINQQRGMDHG